MILPFRPLIPAFLVVLTAILLTGVGIPSVQAAGAKAVASFNDWSAHVISGKSGKICYMHGVPKKSEGKYTTRGDTYLQVTHRTKPRAVNEVSITAGYPYKKDSEVTVAVDGKKFELFTDQDTAWARDAAGDTALVAAMRAGTTMVVRGSSTRGTLTTDTYSLSGFSAAHNAIGKACNVK